LKALSHSLHLKVDVAVVGAASLADFSSSSSVFILFPAGGVTSSRAESEELMMTDACDDAVDVDGTNENGNAPPRCMFMACCGLLGTLFTGEPSGFFCGRS
uniref:Secreted protein n=1 Tax=Haemonchus placei TaxID=6290 RepID=A0A0N4VU52_HAEPC